MTEPEKKKRGRPTEHVSMTPEEAASALDRMLGKEPKQDDGDGDERDDAPRVKSKRPEPE